MPSTVDKQSAAVAAMAQDWPMIDALVGGTKAMRAAGKKLLPQFPAEQEDAYQTRLSTATLFPAFSRTTEILAAKPLSKTITCDKVPADIEALFDNVDREGSTLHAFASTGMLTVLRYGLHGVLVDVPPAPDVRTKADEQAAGIRPYLATYKAADILGWRRDGDMLTQLRLMERVSEPDGEFGEKTILQVRVLIPGAWQTWRKSQTGSDEWVLFDEGTTSLTVIPFVFFYGIRESFGIGRPPLLDLAYMNVEHWQSWSDQQTILHTARVPLLFGCGMNADEPIVVGSGSFIRSSSETADMKYVEHSGAAIEAGRQSILDLEDRMRQTGAELLVQRSMTVTATQTVSETEGSRSILQRIVEGFGESLEECIELMGLWLGQKFECEVTMFTDFGATNLSDQSSTTVLNAVDKGILSPETALSELQRRDIVSPEVQWQDEAKRVEADRKAKAALMPKPETPPKGDPAITE